MNIKERIKKEKVTIPLMLKGYSRTMANGWYGKTQYDLKQNKDEFGTDVIKYWHKKGYLCESIRRYKLLDRGETDYISDFQYMYLSPFNNSFGKWLEDILTTQRVLLPYAEHFREVYFSIIRREGKTLILRVGHEDREYTLDDVVALLREKGSLELRPAFWDSIGKRHVLSFGVDPDSGEETLFSNGFKASINWLGKTIRDLRSNYVIADPVPLAYSFRRDMTLDHVLKFWIANDTADAPVVLCAEMSLFCTDADGGRTTEASLVDLNSGTFHYHGETLRVPGWTELKGKIREIASSISQLTYYSCSLVLSPNGGFTFAHFSKEPKLPSVPFTRELDGYLKDKFDKQFRKRTLGDRLRGLREKRIIKKTERRARKGFRPYMYKLWCDTVRSDFWHTKGVSLSKKIWAWKHGFFSWHTYQYGITKTNYLRFLSDYDYYWLNRINNDYQKWVNDKTTYRMVMEPFKEYLPKYYFSVFNRNGQRHIEKMWDCPADVGEGFDGLLELLRREGKLALKASAGTHGDGFYCLACEDGRLFANGDPVTEDALRKIIDELKSFYIVTEYLVMHEQLRRIYDKSVNTVRMMVINAHGYDPKIMQTYMRIGSSKTGFTDNVGYGGICVFVDKETGELYQPETIKDHVFYACPNHPDTGTPIAGILPNWDLVCEKVLAMSRYLCELEYLGFDIAITDEGLCVLEINIHQDLHKVATYDEEIMDFFRRKMKIKRRMFNAD